MNSFLLLECRDIDKPWKSLTSLFFPGELGVKEEARFSHRKRQCLVDSHRNFLERVLNMYWKNMENKFGAEFGLLQCFYPIEMLRKRENAIRDCIKINAYTK